MQGRGLANNVAVGFDWHQPLRPEQGDATRLALSGIFSPQQIAD